MANLLVQPVPEDLQYLFQPSAINKLTLRCRQKRGQPKSRMPPTAALHSVLKANMALAETDGETNGVHPPDIIELLGPGAGFGKGITAYTTSYQAATAAMTQLLQNGLLEQLHAPGYDKTDVKETSFATTDVQSMDTRQFLLRGNSNFRTFTQTDLSLCRNLIGFASLAEALLDKQPVASFVRVAQPTAERYSDQLADNAEQKAALFAELVKFCTELNVTISSTTAEIASLSERIEKAQEAIDSLDVGKTLVKLLGSLFNLDRAPDAALAQLSALLGITTKVLTGDFKSLFKDKARLQTLLSKLTSLQTLLETTNTSLKALASALADTVEASDLMATVWTDIASNLTTITEQLDDDVVQQRLKPAQVVKVLKSWKDTKANANTFISVLTGAISASDKASLGDVVTLNAVDVGLPRGKHELAMFKMAASTGADAALLEPSTNRALRAMVTNRAITDRVAEQALKKVSPKKFALAAMVAEDEAEEDKPLTEDDIKTQIGYLGPPADVLDTLSKLAGDCSAVNDKFSKMMATASLDSLQIKNPFKNEKTPQEPDDLDLRAITARYQAIYRELQANSVNCARRLITYSAFQLALLPNVTPFAPRPGQVSLEKYLDTCQKSVDDYKDEAEKLSAQYISFKNMWKDAMDNLEERINKATKDAENAQTALEHERDKYDKMTLYGALEIVGGIILFAVGAMFPPVGLLFMAGGAALFAVGIKTLVDRGDLTTAIESYKNAIKAANQLKEALITLREPMQDIADTIGRMSGIWSDITQSLTTISTFMTSWAFDSGNFLVLVDPVIDEWKKVKKYVNDYVGVISGQK